MTSDVTGDRSFVAALTWPARLATAALVATGVVDVVAVAFDRDRYDLLGRIQSGAFVSLSEADASDHRQAVMALVQIALFVVTAIAFIWWFRRAYGNVDALGGKRRFSLGWAIGGWFVPVLAFWRPKQIANDLWLASDPDHPEERESFAGVSPLVTWWWVLFLASSWIGARALAYGGDTTHELKTSTVLYLVSDSLDIVAVCLAVAFVLRLTSRQRQRADRRASIAATRRELAAELDSPLERDARAATERRDGEAVAERFTCDASAASIRDQLELGYTFCKLCGRPLDQHQTAQPN